MKRNFAIALTLASGLALTAAAQTPAVSAAAPAGPAKVAVIEFQAAVGQTNEFQRDLGDLQKKFDPKRAQLKTMADEIDGLEKQLQSSTTTLSDADRADKAKTIEEKKKQAQRFAEDAQNDMGQAMNDEYNKIATKVFDVLSAYVKEHGYSLVLDGSESQQTPSVVLYHVENTDISKAIIEAYNLKSGVPAPPPPAPGAPAPSRPAAKPPVTH
jgi:outer membrane protein